MNTTADEFGDFDDFDDYDVDLPDPKTTNVFDQYKVNNAQAEKATAPLRDDDVAVDDEIVIKKRKRAVKLDENRLCQDDIGIPELERTAAKRLRFKGKGHEYNDLNRILVFYQLWADKLYPKANFADTLAIVEKLGHSKRMRNERLQWMDNHRLKAFNEAEERAGRKPEDDDTEAAPVVDGITAAEVVPGNEAELYRDDSAGRPTQSKLTPTVTTKPTTTNDDSFFINEDDDDMDDMEALIRESEQAQKPKLAEDDMDDLDALIRESEQQREKPDDAVQDEDIDELDAMIREAERAEASKPKPSTSTKPTVNEDGFDDEMELMAEFDM